MDGSEKNLDAQSPDVIRPLGGVDLSPFAIQSAELPSFTSPEQKLTSKSIAHLRESLGHFWRDWRTKFSLVVLGLFVLLALAGPPIYQHIGGSYRSSTDGLVYGAVAYHSYSHEELVRQDELPSSQYWLGTDQVGRDILARLMQGMLISP